jgi:hypothetical protein
MQLAVPPEQGVRRRDRRNVPQGCAAETVRSGGQPPAIVIRETQPRSTELTPQQAVLLNEVRDGLALLPIQPAGQCTQHDLQRSDVDHEAQLTSRVAAGMSIESWHITGTERSQAS